MSRRVYPRPQERVEAKAEKVLAEYSAATDWPPALPVPIEDIIERHFDLRLLWDSIDAGPGEKVLAMLVPQHRQIILNEDLTENDVLSRLGPTNFTLAHELGHWLFDAVRPEQQSLWEEDPVFCRGSNSGDETARIRENNADRFAACLLMPRNLLPLEQLVEMSDGEFRLTAEKFQVSVTALRIRVDRLTRASTGTQLPFT